MKILIPTDGKAGHENQSKAFARALGGEITLVEVHFKSKFCKALSYGLDWLGIHTLALFDAPIKAYAAAQGFDAVVSTGSGTFYAAKTLARKLGIKCGVVLYPRGYRLSTFDCVLAPSFDRPQKAANVIEIPANLVANDEAFYAKGVAAFRAQSAAEPEIAVIIGGPNKCSTMTVEWMKRELNKIFAEPGKKAVTTSRRTPPAVEALVATYPWDYQLIYSKNHFNPIPAFVKLARKIYVTAESTGMLSEACTFGTAVVYALDNLNAGPHKFRRFVENLTAAGYLGGNRKINLTDQFAQAIKLVKRDLEIVKQV